MKFFLIWPIIQFPTVFDGNFIGFINNYDLPVIYATPFPIPRLLDYYKLYFMCHGAVFTFLQAEIFGALIDFKKRLDFQLAVFNFSIKVGLSNCKI